LIFKTTEQEGSCLVVVVALAWVWTSNGRMNKHLLCSYKGA